MFYSALGGLDIVRKTDKLDHQCDPAYWIVVKVAEGVALHTAIVNPDPTFTTPLDRVIAAATQGMAFHSEVELTDNASTVLVDIAESYLGQHYDHEGALRAWDNSGWHATGKQWCSGLACLILQPLLPGLLQWLNPTSLVYQVCSWLGLNRPKLGSSAVQVGDAEEEYLQSLVPEKISTGTMQELLTVCGHGGSTT
jgi:hypothetical protein